MGSDTSTLVKARWVGPFRTLLNGVEHEVGDVVEDLPDSVLQSGHWKQVNSKAPAKTEDAS